jgi:hypothetical protein
MALPPQSRRYNAGFHPLEDFQNGPRIPRPNIAIELTPVVGPAWDALGDLQDGHYGAAALNTGMAALEIIPGIEMLGELGQAAKITEKVGTKVLSHRNVRNAMKSLDKIQPGEELHHVIRMKGASRTSANWKNNPLFTKALPQVTHRRLHTRFANLPKFGPVERTWYGTNRFMKASAAGLLGDVAGAGVAHISHSSEPRQTHGHKSP